MSDDDLIRRGDALNAMMTGPRTVQERLDAIRALPAAPAPPEVGALVEQAANDTRDVFVDCCNHTKEAVDYMEQKLYAAIRALPAATGWQDIATAPRDGTRFFASGGGLDDVDICAYNARIGCWDCGGVTLDDTDYEPEGYNRPTHWQPLPGPPA